LSNAHHTNPRKGFTMRPIHKTHEYVYSLYTRSEPALSASQAWALLQLAKKGRSGRRQTEPLFKVLNVSNGCLLQTMKTWNHLRHQRSRRERVEVCERVELRLQAKLDCKKYEIPLDAPDTWFHTEFPKRVSEEDYFTLKR